MKLAPSRPILAIAALAAALVLSACQPVEVPNPGARVPLKWGYAAADHLNVSYNHAHPDTAGDIYLPKKGGNRGVIILLHGGGFYSNNAPQARKDMADSTGLIMRQTHRGFSVFNISYRGIEDGAPFPAALRDVDNAVNWVRAHGRGRGMNPDTIIVAGGSAGGTLAALSGTASNSNPKGAAGRSARVDGWISMAGIMDGRGEQHVRAWLGPNAKHTAWFGAASPVDHLDPNDPPGYVIHGDADDIVPVQNLDRMVDKGRDAGITDRLHWDKVTTGDRGCRWHFPQCGANANELDRWLDRVVTRGF